MRRNSKRLMALLGLAVLGVAGPTIATAKQPDATLFELTEDMTFDPATGIRAATSAIQGTAKAGTPWCPDALLEQLVALGVIPKKPQECTVNALASNRIETTIVPPAGPFEGKTNTTVQGDNPVDSPELVVMEGAIEGFMSVADPEGRLIRMTGTLTVPNFPQAKFTGVFRLPFVTDEVGKSRKPQRFEPAVYLLDNGRVKLVQPDERALGWPTVRVEVTFE